MAGLKRRNLLQASVAAAGVLAAPQIKAQGKPEKLIYVGDNGPWHYVMVEEVAPAFEKATGIKVDFTLLPVDPWRTRLRAELGSGSSEGNEPPFTAKPVGAPPTNGENEVGVPLLLCTPQFTTIPSTKSSRSQSPSDLPV